jgi:hypothetical protein
MSGAPRAWVWGDRRLWIDETFNDMLALSDEFVAAVGHTHIVVWRRADGAEVRRYKKFVRPEHAWFTEDALCLRTGSRVVVCGLASEAVHERGPAAEDPELPEVTRDRCGGVSLRWPDGRTLSFAYPNALIQRVSVAHAGGRIAVGHGLRCIDIRDARDGTIIKTLAGAGNGVLSPDGRWIAVGGLADRRVHIGAVDAWTPPRGDAPNGSVEALRCSPDGARVLVVAGHEGWILRSNDGSVAARLTGTVDPRAVWTADGAAIVGPSDNSVARWDAGSGQVVRRIDLGARTKVGCFTVDAAGARAAVTLEIYPGGLMIAAGEDAIVFDVFNATELARVRLEEPYLEQVILSDDGLRLALVHEEGARVVTLPDAVVRVPRAAWAGFEAEGVRLLGAEDEECRVRIAGEELAVGVVSAFAATSDGAMWAMSTPDGEIVVRSGTDAQPAICPSTVGWRSQRTAVGSRLSRSVMTSRWWLNHSR